MPKINKIKPNLDITLGEEQCPYEVIIKNKKTGEIVYQDESKAGFICTVEDAKINKVNYEIDGLHQLCSWGNILIGWYALDQANKFFHTNKYKLMEEIKKLGIIKEEQVKDFEKAVDNLNINNSDI